MMAQNPDQQGSGTDPAPPTNFCSLEFIVEKTTLWIAYGAGCLKMMVWNLGGLGENMLKEKQRWFLCKGSQELKK